MPSHSRSFMLFDNEYYPLESTRKAHGTYVNSTGISEEVPHKL